MKADREEGYKLKFMLAGLLVVSLILGLTLSSWGEKPFAGTQLSVITTSDPYGLCLKELLPEFERETGMKVRMETVGYEALREKEMPDFVSGRGGYDVVAIDNVWLGEYVVGGHVLPLNKFVERDKEEMDFDDIAPLVVNCLGCWPSEPPHTIGGIPIGIYARIMIYRKDLFAETGLTVPETFEELEHAAATLTRDLDNDGRVDIYGFTTEGKRSADFAQTMMLWISNFRGLLFDSNWLPLLTSPTVKEAMEFETKMVQNYCPPTVFEAETYTTVEDVAMGRAAIVLGWSAMCGIFEDPEKSRVVGKLGYTLIPHRKGKKRWPGLGGWSLGINADSKHKEAAWEFIKWATSKKTDRKKILMGGEAVRNSSLEDPELATMYPWFEATLETLKICNPDCRPKIPEAVQIQDIMAFYGSEMIRGIISVEEAMAKSNLEIFKLMRKSGYYD